MKQPVRIAGLALALAATLAGAAGADVRLAVHPETTTIAPGDTFLLELRVPVAGSPFNGYDVVVEYDPAVLTFLPTSPTSLQEGTDMKGACGNTFHFFRAAADSLSISHSLLCADLFLTGPAQLYRLRFRASSTSNATHVRLRRAVFYNAGTYVTPVTTSDAVVSWGGTLGAGDASLAPRARLSPRSNPARGEHWLDLASPRDGPQRLFVCDAAGRLVRRLAEGEFPAGSRAVRWDGRDERGCDAPPGVYFVHFQTAGQAARATLVRLR